MHLGFRSHVFLAATLCGGWALPVAGAGPSRTVPSSPEELLQGNVASPPFAMWGESAERVFRRDVRHADYAAEIHYDLGLWFFERGDYQASLKHYQEASRIDPEFAEAFFGIGLLYYTLGDDASAARSYEQALSKDPADPDVRNNLGLIYYRRGDLERAREEIEEALRLQPEFPDALYNLGLVYYQKGQLPAARDQFERAVRRDPEYLRARFNLGVVYYEMGLTDLAAEQWTAIEKSAPGTALAQQAAENLAILRSGKR